MKKLLNAVLAISIAVAVIFPNYPVPTPDEYHGISTCEYVTEIKDN